MKAAKTGKQDKLVKAAVDALEDIKGRDIVVIDVRKITALFDQVIVVSGESTRQNKALQGRSGLGLGVAQGRQLIGGDGLQLGGFRLLQRAVFDLAHVGDKLCLRLGELLADLAVREIEH